jgi:hypothetical protein
MGTKMTMAEAFDEWMRKYRDDPAGFSNTMQDVQSHDRPSEIEGVSEYGRDCAALLDRIMARGADAWEKSETAAPA